MVPPPLQVKTHALVQHIPSIQGERTKVDGNDQKNPTLAPLNSPMTFEIRYHRNVFSLMAQETLEGHGLLIIEALRSHSSRHTAICRTPLDEWSAGRRDLYLATHNTHRTRHPCPRQDSNPRSQQSCGRNPRLTTRPLGSISKCLSCVNNQWYLP